MSTSIFSESWYLVADLKPKLRAHTRIIAHRYRDHLWYVLHDRSNTRFHRFTPAAYFLTQRMDGVLSVEKMWEAVCDEYGEEAPSQDEVIRLLGELFAGDALQCDVSPDTEEVFSRYAKFRARQRKQRWANPMAIRIPIIDPDRFLKRLLPLIGFMFSRWTLVVWTLVIMSGVVLSVMHWPELTHNLSDRVLNANNLMCILAVFPIVKLLHELGHALATKYWGGEVHEMGISFLVFTPVPYVDSSAASAFSDKRKRIAVSAAGIMVELFIAVLALYFWLLIEPGLVSALLFNVMLIGGVSTLFFNGNPLLRFDGYYILADLIEIPNLGARAQAYLGYLIQRYVFGVGSAESPVCADGEAVWFIAYGILAYFYRLFVVVVIAGFVATQFFIVGLILAIFALTMQFFVPACRHVWFLVRSPLLFERRGRAIGSSICVALLVFVSVFYLPMPLWTRAQGVVWLPEGSQLRAAGDGLVEGLLVEPNAEVERGAPLLRLSDPFVDAELAILDARLAEINAQFAAVARQDRVEAELINEQRVALRAERAEVASRAANLLVRSPSNGRLILESPQNLPGRFVRKGELIGYVTGEHQATIRAAVTQSDIVLIRSRTHAVQLKRASNLNETLSAVIKREVPAANNALPSKALGAAAGGDIALDPNADDGLRALTDIFQIELGLSEERELEFFGERVHLRFDHGTMPLAQQCYWRARQLFLRHFRV